MKYLFHLWLITDNELTKKWLNRLSATAVNSDSREQHSQLSSILDYYHKLHDGADSLPSVDWETYQKNIHTPDVVEKI